MLISELANQIGLLIIPVMIGIIVLSLSFHEAMHAFTSHWLGDSTASDLGRLTLNPLKHIDIYTTVLLPVVLILLGLPPFLIAKPVPFNPNRVKWGDFGAALVGVAGPLSNLLLAFFATAIMRLFVGNDGSLLYLLLGSFIEMNIVIFIFNMIPFPPLDGSRVLYAVAPDPVRKVMEQIEATGLIGIFIFIFLLFPLLSPVVTFVREFFFTLLIG